MWFGFGVFILILLKREKGEVCAVLFYFILFFASFIDIVCAEGGEEHCVPAGGWVVGSYVRLVSAWQQSRAPMTVSHS